MNETAAATLPVLVATLIWFPLFAAGLLAVYPLVLRQLRALPAEEYAQAVRAPAWLIVTVGGGVCACSVWALTLLPYIEGQQVFIGFAWRNATLLVDAYTLWGSALFGAVLAVVGWVPAARRSLVPHTVLPSALTLVLVWAALCQLFSIHFLGSLASWLLLLTGTGVLWWYLFRPTWRLDHLNVPLVLVLAGVLGTMGLLMLARLAQAESLTTVWHLLLSMPPRLTNGVMLLLVFGWLGPAVYVPWWVGGRREEQAMVWLPAAMVLAVTGVLSLARVLLLAFPLANPALPVPQLFLIARLLNWMLSWGVLAIIVGAGWTTYLAIRHRNSRTVALRPIALVAAGLLLVGLAGGVHGQQGTGITGMLWTQLAWAGVVSIWLAADGLLPALTVQEHGERATLVAAQGVALAVLAGCPPTPGFHALRSLWAYLPVLGMPTGLLVIAGLLTAFSTAFLLRRNATLSDAVAPRPGVSWGIIGPFAFAFFLLASGVLGDHLSPLFTMIRLSLQPY